MQTCVPKLIGRCRSCRTVGLIFNDIHASRIDWLKLWTFFTDPPSTHGPILLTPVSSTELPVRSPSFFSSQSPPLITAFASWYRITNGIFLPSFIVWGRGSADDKPVLIGVLSALEVMLEGGFRPSRGIVLSFGFDEVSQSQGTIYRYHFQHCCIEETN